jgi:glycosyltransferase involved in cell wall biosynthesis
VGNDGCTDDSVRVAASFGEKVKVLQHPGAVNRGLPATRNLCIQEAHHPLIALLDADDLWLPEHLTALSRAFAMNPTAQMAYDNGYYMTAEGKPYGERIVYQPALDAKTLLLNCCFVPSSVLLRKEVFAQVGLFDESLRYCEDYDMWLRIVERYPVLFIPVDGVWYRQHGNQMTKNIGPARWQYARRVVDQAQARYPYERSVIRNRRAVFSYRMSECAFQNRRFLRGIYHLGKAAWCDPTRAVGQVVQRLLGKQAL